MSSISSPLSKAKLAGMWYFDSKYALIEVHYIAIMNTLCGHYSLVHSVILLCCKYNATLDIARKQVAEDAKKTGKFGQWNMVHLLMAKLAMLEDDSKALSEVSLFLGLFFF